MEKNTKIIIKSLIILTCILLTLFFVTTIINISLTKMLNEIDTYNIQTRMERSDSVSGVGQFVDPIEYTFFDFLFIGLIVLVELLFIGFGLLNVIALIGIFVYGVISIIKKCIK